MLLLYILWDNGPIFMISGSNEQLYQQLEYILIVTAGEFEKCYRDDMQLNCVLNLEKCHRNVWNAADSFLTILHESSISFWVA